MDREEPSRVGTLVHAGVGGETMVFVHSWRGNLARIGFGVDPGGLVSNRDDESTFIEYSFDHLLAFFAQNITYLGRWRDRNRAGFIRHLPPQPFPVASLHPPGWNGGGG